MLTHKSEFLLSTDVELIHKTSMQVLATVGVRLESDDAIDVFRHYGVKTDGRVVFLQEEDVMKAVALAPSQFFIRARHPDKGVAIGDGQAVFAPGLGAPFVLDLETGKRRASMADYRDLVRLAGALPHQDLSGHMLVQPDDVPEQTAYLQMVHASMLHSDKPFMGSGEGQPGARHTMEAASILFGEPPQRLADHPVTISVINSLSPLHYGYEATEALMEYARWRQPIIVATVVMAGATGPITMAGVLAQQNAEILAGITLAQLVSPGTPVVYGSTSTIMDMRTGTLAIGSPELSLAIVATAQMARFYDLPCRSGGSLTDSHACDSQAGFESMFGLLTAAFSGVDFVLHAGGILSSYLAFSLEKFVLDDEMCGMVRRFQKGLDVSPETLAYEVIRNVGPGGNFLQEPHTVQRCRTEFWQPKICYRDGLDIWLMSGQPSAQRRAQRRWQELLASYQDPPLDGTTAGQLRAYLKKHGVEL